jgi:hypothetical protein
MPALATLKRRPLVLCGVLMLFIGLATGRAGSAEPPPPAGEDGRPYRLQVVAGGTVLEVDGSFGPDLVADFEAAVDRGSELRAVRLESPGGRVLAAWQVAAIIQKRGLSTYVGRLCASACTLAFLAGRERWLGPDARLGFHQARTEDGSSQAANKILGEDYEKLGVPPAFVAHILSTAPADLWVPSRSELRAAHVTTTDPPASMLALGDGPAPRLGDVGVLLRTAPEDALMEFATAWSDALYRLQQRDPEACWAFAHEGRGNALDVLPRADLEDFIAGLKYVAEASRYEQVMPLDASQQQQARRELFAAMRANGEGDLLQGLQPGANHAAFCPALRALLHVAMEARRPAALRALLASP